MTDGLVRAYTYLILRVTALICGVGMATMGYVQKDLALAGFGGTLVTTALVTMAQDPSHVDQLVKTAADQATAAASTTQTVTLQQPADAPSPVTLTAKTEPAAVPQPGATP